jgi:hypothetical protein
LKGVLVFEVLGFMKISKAVVAIYVSIVAPVYPKISPEQKSPPW